MGQFLTPDPRSGESLSSWLARSARLYFGSVEQFLRHLDLKIPRDGDRPEDRFISAIAEEVGRPVRQLKSLVVNTPMVCETPTMRRNGLSHMPARLGPFLLYDGSRRYCPLCLGKPDAIWPKSWRIGLPICLPHGVWLENTCGTCGERMPSTGAQPPLRCPRCRTPYAARAGQKAPLSPLWSSLAERIELFEFGDHTDRNEISQDWLQLGALARREGLGGQNPCEMDRVAFEWFLNAADSEGLSLRPFVQCKSDPIVSADLPNTVRPRCLPSRRLSDFEAVLQENRRRVRVALELAEKEMIAENCLVEPRELRKRADAILKQLSRKSGQYTV